MALALDAVAEINAIRRYLLDLGILNRDTLKTLRQEETDKLLAGLAEDQPQNSEAYESLRRFIIAAMQSDNATGST
jgi:hypothetical protein